MKDIDKYVKAGAGIGITLLFIGVAFLFPIPAIILAIVVKVLKGLK